MSEVAYWDIAANDEDVLNNYICNLPDKEFQDAIKDLPEPILDLGCGIGRLTPNNKNAYGIDISRGMLAYAKKAKPLATFTLNDGTTIPYPKEKFKSVFSILTFQHCDIETVESYITEAWRVLKPKGIFYFQFVEGDFKGFVDYNYKTQDIKKLLEQNNFKVMTVESKILPNWTWIKAVKK